MKDYAAIAKEVRKTVLTMVHRAQTSHIGSNFSVIDMAVVLYENLQPEDRVVWSKGWTAATVYAMLARQGKIPVEDLEKFPQEPYIGLAEPSVEGVEVSGGAMGHGLPVAVGIALGKKRAGEKGTVYCIMSDGEMQEGTTWESALVAAHNQLDNLVVLIDYNKWCAMGRTNEVAQLEPFMNKWKAFNFQVFELDDGHDYELIETALKISNHPDVPHAIICNTVKGKGVSFMEDHLLYHYKYVDGDEFKKAMAELV